MMAACTQTKNNPFLEEWNTPYGIPPFEKIQLTDYIPAVKAGIETRCSRRPHKKGRDTPL